MFFDHFEKLCHAHDKSPAAIVKAARMSRNNIALWRAGQSPTLDTICKLATQLGVNPKELIPDETSNKQDNT